VIFVINLIDRIKKENQDNLTPPAAAPFQHGEGNITINEFSDTLYEVESKWPLLKTKRNTFIVCPDSLRNTTYSIIFKTDKITHHAMTYDIAKIKKRIQK
jgi:hypothetical protein